MIDLHRFDWNNHKVLSCGREAPRVHFFPCESAGAAQKEDVGGRVTNLCGQWNFHWFASPLEVPEDLPARPFDPQGPRITVPQNWQYAGHGRYWYTDLLYPFPVDPPHVPAQNETGVYKTAFFLDSLDGQRIFLRFEGVESGFHLYLNGQKAGYSQGSRLPSEFDVTALVREGENQLTVVVYQYCDGTYLEDQDMWWLGGITRDVWLIRRPQCYLRDMVLDPDYDVQSGDGILRPRLPLSDPEGRVELTVFDPQGNKVDYRRAGDTLLVPHAIPWTAETPVLYKVIATVYDPAGKAVEAVPQRIGFRHVEIRRGVLEINGRPIFMRGVNRHEYNPKTGRAVTEQDTRRELELVKLAGLNAVRCSHYPNNPFFYDLCEELGLYVIDECDLETHGFEPLGQETRLNSDPDWRDAYLDRVQRMVGRDRNRACVVIWSLGNESAYGPNFKAMYDWCKENEPSRPVHYEGDFKNESVDVSSTMYTTIGRLKELDTQLEPKRPHILCEFGHAMGNGPGSLKEYFEVCEHSQRIQGMFVWELKDHGVWEKRADGKELYRFGGEFGEKFHNGNFCMDGLLRSDGIPTPGFWEYARVAEPIHVEAFDLEQGFFRVKNRFDFLDLSAFRCVARVLCDGEPAKEYALDIPATGPRQTCTIPLPRDLAAGCPAGTLVTLEVEFLSTGPVFGRKEAGWVAGRAGAVVRGEQPLPETAQAAACALDGHMLKVTGKDFSFWLDPVTGRVRHYTVGGTLLLEDGPLLNYQRPYTDNDAPNRKLWDAAHLHSMQMCVETLDWQQAADVLNITVRGKFSPAGLDWGTRVTVTYQVWNNGTFTVSITGDFYGRPPEELPKIGSCARVPAVLEQVTWHGYGPGECYRDSREAQTQGIWHAKADNMGFAYSCPQENANRTGVYWAVLADAAGTGLAVAANRPLDMAVRPWDDEMIQKTAHSCDLQPSAEHLYLHLDYCNSGLGSGSCGPTALAQYKAYPIHYQWKMAFAPKSAAEAETTAARRAMGRL